MEKLKCPRCENEKLKGPENYCPICGLNLKERTAQEVPVQEQSNSYYPIELKFTAPLITQSCFDKNKIIHSEDAICLKLKINSNEYDKQEILKELNLICQQLLEYFH